MNRTLIYGLVSLLTTAGAIGTSKQGEVPKETASTMQACTTCVSDYPISFDDMRTKLEKEGLGQYPVLVGYEPGVATIKTHGVLFDLFCPGEEITTLLKTLPREKGEFDITFLEDGFVVKNVDGEIYTHNTTPLIYQGSVYEPREKLDMRIGDLWDHDGDGTIDSYAISNDPGIVDRRDLFMEQWKENHYICQIKDTHTKMVQRFTKNKE